VSCSYPLRSVCGTSTLSAQCSATVVQLHSDIVYKTGYWKYFCFISKCNMEQLHGLGGIETYTIGVYCEEFSV